MHIRAETPRDHKAVSRVVTQAFGRPQEARLVDELRAGGALVVSLVAEQNGEIRGHVALSRLVAPANALALAPVAVLPSFQKRGIGSALIRDALGRAQSLGAGMVFVLGEPDFYDRFGFTGTEAAPFTCDFAGPYFQALRLNREPVAAGPVIYAEAFARAV